MELTIEVEDEKMENLMKIYHTNDKQDAVKKALEEAVSHSVYQSLLDLKGKVKWQGDLAELRSNRV